MLPLSIVAPMPLNPKPTNSTSARVKLALLVGVVLLATLAGGTWMSSHQNTTSNSVPAAPPPDLAAAPVPSNPIGAAESLDVDPALLELRRAYESPSTRARRVRLQGKLDRKWGSEPHLVPVEMLLSQVEDRQAPGEYRVFVAKLLRNAAKRSPDGKRRERIASGLRRAVSSKAGEITVRARLALVLIDTDPSPRSVDVIAPLLEEGADSDAQTAASALARSACPEAREALWQFVRRHATDPGIRPLTLGAALLPLCYEESLPVEPLLARLLRNTDDEVLLSMVLQGVNARSGSQKVAAALVSIAGRKLSQGSPATPFSRRLRAALRKQKAAIDANPGGFDEATKEQIQELLTETI